ncbi:hypothetical protein [Micromonospora sp. CB01531]|uniref:hypothetical protein n=1 Tax=Micromonospora sp. CB01531 TaxID=1718947 RepID=UPI0013011AA3|nr:hypothetical protein [Micromonospora sp. CB01531]
MQVFVLPGYEATAALGITVAASATIAAVANGSRNLLGIVEPRMWFLQIWISPFRQGTSKHEQ